MKQVVVIALIGLAAVGLSVEAKEWYETASFYQIYPISFFDGGGGFNGTGSLKGIEAKLDYIKDLGIDCLWLTPIFKSSFNAFGYDITEYEDIDPRYGTKDHFVSLIKAVHSKGMKIIVDFVPNHCGVAHDFFKRSVLKDTTYDDWFLWSNVIGYDDDKPSNWQSMGGPPGSAWTKPEGRNDFYYARFHPNMPDLNLRNPNVLAYLKSVMKFWLDLDIDGFRIDAISYGIEAKPDQTGLYPNEAINTIIEDALPENIEYLYHNLTQDQSELFEIIYDWRKFLNEYSLEKQSDARIMMTESYSSIDVIKKFYISDDGTKNGAHLPFNFLLIDVIKNSSMAEDFVKSIGEWLDDVPSGKVTNWVIGNHDQPRVASRFGKDRVDIFNTLVTMLPGTSVTYYGEEIGMLDSCAEFKTDDHNIPAERCDPAVTQHTFEWVRSPMQWDDTQNAGFSPHAEETIWMPVAENYKTINVKAQEEKENSHLKIHRQLLKLRKHNAIMESEIFVIKALSEKSFAFKREFSDKKQQSVLVIINFGHTAEKVHFSQNFTGFPDLITVEIAGGNSAFKKGDQIKINEMFELKAYDSIVALYNGSAIFTASKIVFALAAVFVYLNLKA